MGLDKAKPISINNFWNQITSHAQFESVQYSTSQLQRVVVVCFFELHEIGVVPNINI